MCINIMNIFNIFRETAAAAFALLIALFLFMFLHLDAIFEIINWLCALGDFSSLLLLFIRLPLSLN